MFKAMLLDGLSERMSARRFRRRKSRYVVGNPPRVLNNVGDRDVEKSIVIETAAAAVNTDAL